jgi:hypothetical protein
VNLEELIKEEDSVFWKWVSTIVTWTPATFNRKD